MKRKYAVMEFEPSEGMNFYGVFDTQAEAVAWAEELGCWRMPWFVVDIMDHEYAAELAKGADKWQKPKP